MEEDIFELNDIEIFLKQFLEDYPSYSLDVVDEKEDSFDKYSQLVSLMDSEWKKKNKNKKFFLENNISYVTEDFFLKPDENVTMRKNLRYMPLIMHSHQFIEVNYVINSAGACMITRSGRQPLSDGDIILCPPNFVHCFDTRNDRSVILDFFIRVTTFDTAFFQLLNRNDYLSTVFSNALYNSEGSYVLWHCREDQQLQELVLSSFTEWLQKPKYSEQMLEANILKFFILLMREHEEQAEFSIPHVDSTDSVFHSLHNYMLIHCQTITLSTLSTQFGYSDRQVIRILKKNTGKGFSELLQDIRMNKAIQMLKNPSMSIPQISKMLGFSSLSYFQHVFKKTFSFTPEAFQKRVADLHSDPHIRIPE